MAVSAVTIPTQYRWLGQPAYFKVSTSGSGTIKKMKALLEVDTGSGYNAVITLIHNCDGNNEAQFEFNKLIESHLDERTLPNFSTELQAVETAAISYRVTFTEILDDVEGGILQSSAIEAFRGQWPFHYIALNLFFDLTTIFPAGLSHWLTTRKDTYRVFYKGQIEFLYVLTRYSINHNVEVIFTDNTSTVYTTAFSFQSKHTYALRIDEAYNNIFGTGKEVDRILVYLNDNGKPTITYIADTQNPITRQFFYENSLKGLESFVCTGKLEELNEYQGQEYELTEITNNFDVTKGKMSVLKKGATSKFKINSGYKLADEIQAFRDAVNNRVWVYEYNSFIPVIITSVSGGYKSEEDFYPIEIEYKYAFQLESFNPVHG